MGRHTVIFRLSDFTAGGGSRLQPFRYVQGRGRDSGCPLPPAQTRAGAASAHGSYLGCLASKRTLGSRMFDLGERNLDSKPLQKALPGPTAPLTSPPKLV